MLNVGNISTKFKLYLVTGFILVGLAIVGIISYSTANSLSMQSTKMYENAVLGLQYSANAGMQIQRGRFLAKVITDETLRSTLQDSIKDLKDQQEKENLALTNYEKTILSDEDRENFNATVKFREEYVNVLKTTILLVNSGKFKEAHIYVNANKEMSRNYAASITKVIDWNVKTAKNLKIESDVLAHNAMNKIIITTIVILLFGFFSVYFIVRKIETSLHETQLGLRGFFAFLHRDSNQASIIEINSKDEFGMIAHEINENIQKVEAQINLDNNLVASAKYTINRVQHGWYNEFIEATTTNQSLEEFKNSVNDMIKNTQNHFISMNAILEQYADYDYTKELRLDNIDKGGVYDTLVVDINKLRSAVTHMLTNSLQNGLELKDEAVNLKVAVESLSTASNQQAANLEETAAAMEEMTSNVKNNAQKSNDMAAMAAQTDRSAKEGAELAQRTSSAMIEIQHATDSINDAVAIIENIAFQTNILSLNAAVEAATAGDAGKGFAVVAQEVRNLANRSADAAKEIKALAAQASRKSNEGTVIATELTRGFEEIADKIAQTTILVQDVSDASREQMQGISQINTAIAQLDHMTQENAKIASQAESISEITINKAQSMVEDSLNKNFIGKDKIQTQPPTKSISTRHETKKTINTTIKKSIPQSISTITHDENDVWESF